MPRPAVMVTESESEDNSSFVHIPKDSKSSTGSEQQYYIGFYENNSANPNGSSNTSNNNNLNATPSNTVKHQKNVAPNIMNEYPVLSGGLF